jgi:hypothetical protein
VFRQNVWWRILTFVLLLLGVWALPALLIYGWGSRHAKPDTATILALVVLYSIFIGLLRQWGRHLYHWPKPLQHYGLVWSRGFAANLSRALLAGLLVVLGLFGIEVLWGWAIALPPSWRLPGVMVEGLLMALAVGFAEELLFRGWLLAELDRDYSAGLSRVINSLLFATVHFIKPLPAILHTLPQFFGLFMLGMVLVWARRIPCPGIGLRQAPSLAYPMGFHAGLVWGYYIIQVGMLVKPSGTAPEWLTGINGNPLAGLLGLGLLSVIAVRVARWAQPGDWL